MVLPYSLGRDLLGQSRRYRANLSFYLLDLLTHRVRHRNVSRRGRGNTVRRSYYRSD